MDHPGSPADHGDALDLDQHAGPREVRNSDERAGRVVAVGEELPAQLDEAVAVARIVDEYRHGDHVGEAAAGTPQRRVDERKDRTDLRVEPTPFRESSRERNFPGLVSGPVAFLPDRAAVSGDFPTSRFGR